MQSEDAKVLLPLPQKVAFELFVVKQVEPDVNLSISSPPLFSGANFPVSRRLPSTRSSYS